MDLTNYNERDQTFNVMTYHNGYFNKPPVVDIKNIRYYSIIEIYNLIKEIDKKFLDKLPNSLVYLKFKKINFDNYILLKSCVIEEFIHKNALFMNKTLESQHELNLNYYKVFTNVKEKIVKFKNNQQFNILNILNLEKNDYKVNLNNYILKENLLPLLVNTPDAEFTFSSNLELHYTKLSIYEELFLQNIKSKNSVCKTKQMIKNLSIYNKNICLYNYPNCLVHNKEPLKTTFDCIVCSDNCTEYADCMYSNCRHMCLCYNCSKKLKDFKCIVCNQYNDTLIQVYKP